LHIAALGDQPCGSLLWQVFKPEIEEQNTVTQFDQGAIQAGSQIRGGFILGIFGKLQEGVGLQPGH
jgi:hypothetical protein